MLKVNIQKKLTDFELKIEFEMPRGEFLGFLGASGCGKSMTLKCIAGIETPDSGRIALGERVLFDSAAGVNLPPQERKIGYLFQNYALFPQMSVWRNVFVSVNSRYEKDEKIAKTHEILERLGLENFAKCLPSQISGGQQQRVALARIIVNEPEFLLLDEPFSALDAFLKWQLAAELREVVRGIGRGAIVVSHNINEIYFLCERAAILERGSIAESGTLAEILERPREEITKKLIAFCDFGRREIDALLQTGKV